MCEGEQKPHISTHSSFAWFLVKIKMINAKYKMSFEDMQIWNRNTCKVWFIHRMNWWMRAALSVTLYSQAVAAHYLLLLQSVKVQQRSIFFSFNIKLLPQITNELKGNINKKYKYIWMFWWWQNCEKWADVCILSPTHRPIHCDTLYAIHQDLLEVQWRPKNDQYITVQQYNRWVVQASVKNMK